MSYKEQKKTDDKGDVSRRGFILGAWGLSMLAIVGEGTLALLKMIQPVKISGGGIVDAGPASSFEVGSVTENIKGRFYLVRLEDGFIAYSKTCTHLGCSYKWEDSADQFQCPCHGSLFNLEGEVVGGPAPRPLDLFAVEVVDGNVMVDTGKVTKRDKFDPSQTVQV